MCWATSTPTRVSPAWLFLLLLSTSCMVICINNVLGNIDANTGEPSLLRAAAQHNTVICFHIRAYI
jgi:hypothetical protein